MIDYINIVESLFSQPWFFPLFILSCLAIYYFEKFQPKSLTPCILTKENNRGVWIAALTLLMMFSAPYWMLGHNAPHGGSDDSSMALQTYLSASHQGNSINWTNGILGGLDRWLLANCHPLALVRIYALFLKEPVQLYLWVIGINVILVFIFSWKIQTEFLGVRRWMAYIGAIDGGYHRRLLDRHIPGCSYCRRTWICRYYRRYLLADAFLSEL